MPSPNINTTDTLEQGRQKINAHFNDATQHGGGGGGGADLGWVNVKDHGASGTGSGGASQDQSGFSAAISQAGSNGTVYIPPGNYYLSGGFNLGKHVRIVGAGTHDVLINHTGNNTLFNHTSVESGNDIHKRRGFMGFEIAGNAGTSAKGIVHGNGYGALFEDITVWGYTNGTGITNVNSATPTYGWTEGIVMRDIHARYCKDNLLFDISGSPDGSFSDLRLYNVLSVAGNGQTAMRFAADSDPYAADFFVKIHLEGPTAKGLVLEQDVALFSNMYNIYFEQNQLPTAGHGGIVAHATSKMWGLGQIFPNPNTAFAGTGEHLHAISEGALIDVAPAPATRIRHPAPASDQYHYISTLPASGNGTWDKLIIHIEGGIWTESEGFDAIQLANRAGFRYSYLRRGSTNSARNGLRVVAYKQGDGSVKVYLRSVAGNYTSAMVKSYGIGQLNHFYDNDINDRIHNYPPQSPTGTVPTGTLIFDSATAAPNVAVHFKSVTLPGGPTIVSGPGVPTDNSLPLGSLHLGQNGTMWLKTGATSWTQK
jgi:hypothetical protein